MLCRAVSNNPMRILKVLGALILITGTWWSMASLAWSSELLQTKFGVVMAQPLMAPPADPDLIVFDHRPTYCCDSFAGGVALSFVTIFFGGIPMAALAFILRRSLITFRPAAEPFFLAGFIFQFAAFATTLLMTLLLLLDVFVVSLNRAWYVAFPLLTVIASAWALPLWHRLRRSIVATESWPIELHSAADSTK
jgi:hypothetical protein